METNSNKDFVIYGHIMTLYREAKKNSWASIKRSSVFRSLYLSSVLYSFAFEDVDNPFAIYKFSIDRNGPYEKDVSDALEFLVKDDYLEFEQDGGSDVFRLGSHPIPEFETAETNEYDWIKLIVDILNIYGEDKIYEFIFRDPEYRRGVQSDTPKTLTVNPQNESVRFLKQFEQAFEESISGANYYDKQEYLKLYFEFLFSKILNKEI